MVGFLYVLLAGILWNAPNPKKASKKDQRDIKKAYHNLAKLWYLDKKEEGKKEEATEKFQSNSDTSRRQLYLSQFQLLPSHIQLLPSHLQLFPSHRGNDSTNGEHQISSAIVSARWYNINKHWLMVASDDADVICGHVTV